MFAAFLVVDEATNRLGYRNLLIIVGQLSILPFRRAGGKVPVS